MSHRHFSLQLNSFFRETGTVPVFHDYDDNNKHDSIQENGTDSFPGIQRL